jgi:hypothetical protein
MDYFLFDADLNVVEEVPSRVWPVAVMAALQTCVRRALADGRSTFTPSGMGPLWSIVPVSKDGRAGFGVFPEQWN